LEGSLERDLQNQAVRPLFEKGTLRPVSEWLMIISKVNNPRAPSELALNGMHVVPIREHGVRSPIFPLVNTRDNE